MRRVQSGLEETRDQLELSEALLKQVIERVHGRMKVIVSRGHATVDSCCAFSASALLRALLLPQNLTRRSLVFLHGQINLRAPKAPESSGNPSLTPLSWWG